MVRRGGGRLMPSLVGKQFVGAGFKPALTFAAQYPGRKLLLWATVALVLAAALACAGPAGPTPYLPALTEPPPATAAAVAVTPTTLDSTAAAAPPTVEPEDQPYDSNRAMYRIWHGLGHPPETTLSALADAEKYDDKSQVVVILEALKFFGLDAARGSVETLTALTGQTFDFDRRRWREWVGPRSEEYAPPSDYPRWKVDSLAVVDPAIGAIMEQGITRSRVDLTEVVWGGVRLDGIPPLEQPPYILAEQATWLWPDDRVFGVSINGDHRAYPLRVMNAHELANDTLGGEPVSLVY